MFRLVENGEEKMSVLLVGRRLRVLGVRSILSWELFACASLWQERAPHAEMQHLQHLHVTLLGGHRRPCPKDAGLLWKILLYLFL